MRASAVLLAGLLSACATHTTGVDSASVTTEAVEPWREMASPADAARLEALGTTWTRAAARLSARTNRAMAAEGALLKPDAALPHPELSPGSYDCRMLRMGDAAGPARLRSYKSNFCYVTSDAGGTLSLTKQTGGDLPAGRLYPSGETRYVFLGAMQGRADDPSLGYGSQPAKDVVGVVERIAPFRWRLVVPARDGRSIDVLEMTPVPVERQPG